MLKIWNTADRKIEEFKSLIAGHVKMYACGPTVYQRSHIGNLRSYTMEDIFRRVLENEGNAVEHVVNITDVGHLTDDADSGEDKLEKASAESHESAKDIAERYTEAIFQRC